jgi:hypothetical protein
VDRSSGGRRHGEIDRKFHADVVASFACRRQQCPSADDVAGFRSGNANENFTGTSAAAITGTESEQETAMSEAIFKGASGKLYRFHVLRAKAPTLAEPAVYAFARPGPGPRGWTPLFLSRTGNLADRLNGHERWDEAQRLGATHILALFEPERDLRGAAEADLLEALRPALNAPSLDTAESGGPERIVTFVRPPVLFDPPIRVAREA